MVIFHSLLKPDMLELEKMNKCKFITTLLSLRETHVRTLCFISPVALALLHSSPSSMIISTANIIFMDIPAGAGFAYAKTWEASISSDSILALNAYDFLKKWLMEHPRFLNNSLYISGVSYNGIMVPTVALEIYKSNERGDQLQLNIQGCILVSSLTDKFLDFNSRLEFAHRFALISDEIYESAKGTCHGNYIYNDPNNIECSNNLQRVDQCTSKIEASYILDPLCNATILDPSCRGYAKIILEIWANDKKVQKALGIREGTFERWESENTSIHYELYKNDSIYYSYDIFTTIPYHKQLVARDCRLLVVCGDHDMVFPYVGTEAWVKTLDLPIQTPWVYSNPSCRISDDICTEWILINIFNCQGCGSWSGIIQT